jgi:hypothetical protein
MGKHTHRSVMEFIMLEEKSKRMYNINDTILAGYYEYRKLEEIRKGKWRKGFTISPPCTCPSPNCKKYTQKKLDLVKNALNM